MTPEQTRIIVNALLELKSLPMATKEKREELLAELRKQIAEQSQMIQGMESLMRQGMPPLDVEDLRVGLDQLRRLERWLMGLQDTPL
jgi:hypothetical protein